MGIMDKLKNRSKKNDQNVSADSEKQEETIIDTPAAAETDAGNPVKETETQTVAAEETAEPAKDDGETVEKDDVNSETEAKTEEKISGDADKTEEEPVTATEKTSDKASDKASEEVVIDADDFAEVKVCGSDEAEVVAQAEAKAKVSADDVKPEEPEKIVFDGIDRDALTDEEYIDALEKKLGQSMSDAVMCRNLAQRLQADFDNYRKRNNSLSEEMKKIGTALVIEKMLTVLDNCGLARKYISDESALQGFNMMETQILSALDSFGLKEIEAENMPFDAKLMTAVEKVSSKNNTDKVVEVTAKGYTLDGKLLRPAAVKVGK